MESKQTGGGQEPSAIETVHQIVAQAQLLIHKQVELAKAELKADLHAEGKAVGSLGIAAVAGLSALNLLLVTGALALAVWMPAWTAGLLVTGVVVLLAGLFALFGWRTRVKHPLAQSREELKQDAQFTKERLI
jgi:uncharacterized membrane protein YqjE